MNSRESELNEKQDGLVIDGNPPERWATQPMRGSSVTGERTIRGKPTGEPFGAGSDYDLAISGSKIFNRAKELGIEIRGGGTRTAALSTEQIKSLGLDELAKRLSEQAGRPVTFMIYESTEAVAARGPLLQVF